MNKKKEEKNGKIVSTRHAPKVFCKRQQNHRHKNVNLRFGATTKVVSNARGPSSKSNNSRLNGWGRGKGNIATHM